MTSLATLLKRGPYHNAEFVFWEQDYAPQHFPISAQAIDAMVQHARFPALKILLPVWDVDAVVHGVLRLEGGEEYPLSAFPRCLLVGGRSTSSLSSPHAAFFERSFVD